MTVSDEDYTLLGVVQTESAVRTRVTLLLGPIKLQAEKAARRRPRPLRRTP